MKNFCRIIMLVSAAFLFGCGCEKEGGDDKGQSGKPYIKLGFSEKLVNNEAGSFDVYVNSNTEWTVESQAEWISVVQTEGKGSRNVTVRYESNYIEGTPGEERTGTVRFSAQGTIPTKFTVKQGARTFRNPVFQPMPDPYIWREPNGQSATYYPCKSNGNGVNLGKTNRMTVWGGTKEVWHLPSDGAVKVWNRANLWAPELHRIDGVWYIYYAAGRPTSETNGSYGTQRTGVIRCKSADPTTGTWEDMGQIFTGNEEDFKIYKETGKVTTENNIYAIDMTVFELNGQLYAVWSGNTSKTNGNQRLYIATMDNPYTINCARVELSMPGFGWEKEDSNLLEGPAMLFNPDKTKLFCVYSCNGSWTKYYKLGLLELDLSNPATSDPMNPKNWTKSTTYAFYRCDNVSKSSNPHSDKPQNEATMNIGGVHGVGHNTFTKSPDGTEDWIVYHTKRYVDNGWDNRDAFIQKFTWNENGRPDFGKPVGWYEETEVPSGEPQQ